MPVKGFRSHPIQPVKFGRIQPGINYWSNWVEIHSFGGHNLNGFTPNWTGQIRPVEFGCKSIEIDAGRFGCKSIEIDAG